METFTNKWPQRVINLHINLLLASGGRIVLQVWRIPKKLKSLLKQRREEISRNTNRSTVWLLQSFSAISFAPGKEDVRPAKDRMAPYELPELEIWRVTLLKHLERHLSKEMTDWLATFPEWSDGSQRCRIYFHGAVSLYLCIFTYIWHLV